MKLARELGTPTWSETNPASDSRQAKQLWNGVEEDTGNPLLLHFLSGLIEKANIPARDPMKLARVIQLYSARKIKYFRERPERFQSAMRTVAWGFGDCDDKSRFIAASLRSFRIPVRLKFIRFTVDNPNGSKSLKGHVYPQAYINGKWFDLDSVREKPIGYDPEKVARKRGYNVKVELVGDNENS